MWLISLSLSDPWLLWYDGTVGVVNFEGYNLFVDFVVAIHENGGKK